MTDKQSTVVVSRELAKRIQFVLDNAAPLLNGSDPVRDEFRALRVASINQPAQAVDAGEPVAYVTENPHCPEGMSDEISEYLPVGTELFRHAQPPTQPRITMADTMRAYQSAARSPHLVGTSNWCAHMAEQLNQCSELATVCGGAPNIGRPHSAQIKGMIPTPDGQHAVMIDRDNGHYGWAFFKHHDGTWVSSRKATEVEIHAARRASLNTPQD